MKNFIKSVKDTIKNVIDIIKETIMNTLVSTKKVAIGALKIVAVSVWIVLMNSPYCGLAVATVMLVTVIAYDIKWRIDNVKNKRIEQEQKELERIEANVVITY